MLSKRIFKILSVLMVLGISSFSLAQNEPIKDQEASQTASAKEAKSQSDSDSSKSSEESKDPFPSLVKIEVRRQFLHFLIFSFLGGLSIGGIGTLIVCMKWTRKKIKEALEEGFYAIDARRLRLGIPEVNFEAELKMLDQWGFQNFKKYSYPSKSLIKRGCLIVKCTTDVEEDDLEVLIQELSGDPEIKIGVIAYTAGVSRPLRHARFIHYPFFQIANSPSTIPGAIWNLGRGLCN